jgi:hypothetical protein
MAGPSPATTPWGLLPAGPNAKILASIAISTWVCRKKMLQLRKSDS